VNNVSLVIDQTKSHDVKNESDILALIEVPEDIFPTNFEVVHSFYYKDASFFLSADKLKQITEGGEEETQILQSTILSFSIGSKVTENLSTPIILTFKKIVDTDRNGINLCSFWDFDLPTGINGVFGGWSSRGCKLSNRTAVVNYVTCECDHLTNFALLLDVSQSGNNPLELQIVTWIGCGISMVCLTISVVTFIVFRELRKKIPQKLLLSLCISLLLLLIIFLAGAEQTSPRVGCQIVAGLLHYFILTTFCWMFIQATNLYRSFVRVFNKGSSTRFFIHASIFSWGLPLIIVVVTACIQPDKYGDAKLCIVRGYPFYFGVLLPVAGIILYNFVVLVVVMKVLTASSKQRASSNDDQNPFASVRIAFSCNLLLGTTWIFAVLAVGDATLVFQWLFCIFNSLQGFFIFVFYVARSNDVRNTWRRCVGLKVVKNVYSTSRSRQTMKTSTS